MARSRLPSVTKGKHINKNVWSHVKYSPKDPDAPYTVGQILHVYPQNSETNFIPCMPKPGTKSFITRVEYKTKVMFLGMVEFLNNTKCMHFKIENNEGEFENEVLLGLGCLPHLCNIPKRPTKGLNAKPKRKHPKGSGRGGKKSPARLARLQAKKRADVRRKNKS